MTSKKFGWRLLVIKTKVVLNQNEKAWQSESAKFDNRQKFWHFFEQFLHSVFNLTKLDFFFNFLFNFFCWEICKKNTLLILYIRTNLLDTFHDALKIEIVLKMTFAKKLRRFMLQNIFVLYYKTIQSWGTPVCFVIRSIGHLSVATSVGNRSVTSMWRERYWAQLRTSTL